MLHEWLRLAKRGGASLLTERSGKPGLTQPKNKCSASGFGCSDWLGDIMNTNEAITMIGKTATVLTELFGEKEKTNRCRTCKKRIRKNETSCPHCGATDFDCE